MVQAAQDWYITAQTAPGETELLCSLEHSGNELGLPGYPRALLVPYATHPLPASVASQYVYNKLTVFLQCVHSPLL